MIEFETPRSGNQQRFLEHPEGPGFPSSRPEGPFPALAPATNRVSADRRRTHFLHSHSQQILTETVGVYGERVCQIHPYRGTAGETSGQTSCTTAGRRASMGRSMRVVVNDATPELLREKLASRRWRPAPITFAGPADCYQPIERQLRLTRRCLEVLVEARNPVVIHTNSDLILRDLDLLAGLARRRSAQVYFSLTTLDDELAERLEPGGTPPAARLEAIRRLADAGIPTSVVAAPILPGLNDSEIPAILGAAAQAGAHSATWAIGGLPHDIEPEFWAWLKTDRPMMEKKVAHGQPKRTPRKTVAAEPCETSPHAARRSSVVIDKESHGGHQAFRPNYPRLSAIAEDARGHLSESYQAQVEGLFSASSRRFGLDQPLPLMDGAQFRRPKPGPAI